MRAVNMQGMIIVHCGEEWQHEEPPCSRSMVKFLERNEDVVTWVQPETGAVQDQFPVIRMRGGFYSMSLRMMKAVWRNVRLRKGFSNVERAAFGGLKLRIPEQLYTEKMRTQTRFNLMRMECDEPSTLPKDRKPMNNASSKVNLVVQRMLFPMLDSPMRTHVLLDTDADQIELDLLDQVGRARPELMDDPQSLVSHLLSLMERYRWSAGKGYGRVATDVSRGLT